MIIFGWILVCFSICIGGSIFVRALVGYMKFRALNKIAGEPRFFAILREDRVRRDATAIFIPRARFGLTLLCGGVALIVALLLLAR